MPRSNRRLPEWHDEVDENNPYDANIRDGDVPWRHPYLHSGRLNDVPASGQYHSSTHRPYNSAQADIPSQPSSRLPQTRTQSARAQRAQQHRTLPRGNRDHGQQQQRRQVSTPTAMTTPGRARASREGSQLLSRLRGGSRAPRTQQTAIGPSSLEVRQRDTQRRYAPYAVPTTGGSTTQPSPTSSHVWQRSVVRAGDVSRHPSQGVRGVPEFVKSAINPFRSIEAQAAADRRRAAIQEGVSSSRSPGGNQQARRTTLDSGERPLSEIVALPPSLPLSLPAAAKDDGDTKTADAARASHSAPVDISGGTNSTASVREPPLHDPFHWSDGVDFENVDESELDESELNKLLAQYDWPTVKDKFSREPSPSLPTAPTSSTPSTSPSSNDGKRPAAQGTGKTSFDPIVLLSSSPPSSPALYPQSPVPPSLKSSAPGGTSADDSLVAATPAKKQRRLAAQLDKLTKPIPKVLSPNAHIEVTVATIENLLAAVTLEVPHLSNIPSAAELVASFDGLSEEGRRRAANIIDNSHPLVLTREALETILAFVAEADSHGNPPPLTLLAGLIVCGRLEQATTLVFQELPGGNINMDDGEYFPADNTLKLLETAHKTLVPFTPSSSLPRVLCPKVTTVIIRQTAAEDFFDNSHVAMGYLALLAAPSNLCIDFDLSFRGLGDIIFDPALGDNLDDMSSERGAALGDLVKTVWPFVKVINFHHGAGKTLPYCRIPIKHVAFYGSGRFDKSNVSLTKRLTALNTWKDNSIPVIFKELLRAEAQRSARAKKGTSQTTTDKFRGSEEKRELVTPSLTRPERKGPVWATINPVWAAEEAEKRIGADQPDGTEATPDEAQWEIHLHADLENRRDPLLASLHQSVKQLVMAREQRQLDAAREQREPTKMKKRRVEGAAITWGKAEVRCDSCQTLCFDGRPTTQLGARRATSVPDRPTRGSKMQGKTSKTGERKSAAARTSRMKTESHSTSPSTPSTS